MTRQIPGIVEQMVTHWTTEVHFNRLKPCPKNVCLNQPTSISTPPHDQQQLRATGTHSIPQTVMPSNIEFVEKHDVSTPAPGTPENKPQPDLPAVCRNPERNKTQKGISCREETCKAL